MVAVYCGPQIRFFSSITTKNGKSCSVPMNDVLTTTLKAVRMNTLADRLVFCSYQGTP
jgi:hypothetical protein